MRQRYASSSFGRVMADSVAKVFMRLEIGSTVKNTGKMRKRGSNFPREKFVERCSDVDISS